MNGTDYIATFDNVVAALNDSHLDQRALATLGLALAQAETARQLGVANLIALADMVGPGEERDNLLDGITEQLVEEEIND